MSLRVHQYDSLFSAWVSSLPDEEDSPHGLLAREVSQPASEGEPLVAQLAPSPNLVEVVKSPQVALKSSQVAPTPQRPSHSQLGGSSVVALSGVVALSQVVALSGVAAFPLSQVVALSGVVALSQVVAYLLFQSSQVVALVLQVHWFLSS